MQPPSTQPIVFYKQRLALVSVVFSLTLSGCGAPPPPQAATPPALPVSVLEVQPANLPSTLEAMAQTEGSRETEVRSRVGGILLRRLYVEGEPVKAGQPLFQIDRAPFENVLSEARAKAEQTARETARLKGLLERQAVSRKEYDDMASANAAAQAALRQAELNLSWTTVTAPVSGVSGRANKSEGNLITTTDPTALTSITQSNPMWVRFGLSESDTAALPEGRIEASQIRKIELLLPDGGTYEKPGKINFMASTIDPALGTRQMRAEFENPAGQLLPGQFVRVRLLVGERTGVFLVPQAAVLQTEQGQLVMLADADNKVAPRPVQTAEWYGKDWVITGGLKAGDRVIVDNLMKLRPGALVQPQPASPAAAQNSPSARP